MDMITISLENGKIMVIKLVYSYLIPIRVEPCLFSLFLEHLKIQLQIFANRVNRVLITLNQKPSKPSTTRTEMPIPTNRKNLKMLWIKEKLSDYHQIWYELPYLCY